MAVREEQWHVHADDGDRHDEGTQPVKPGQRGGQRKVPVIRQLDPTYVWLARFTPKATPAAQKSHPFAFDGSRLATMAPTVRPPALTTRDAPRRPQSPVGRVQRQTGFASGDHREADRDAPQDDRQTAAADHRVEPRRKRLHRADPAGPSSRQRYGIDRCAYRYAVPRHARSCRSACSGPSKSWWPGGPIVRRYPQGAGDRRPRRRRKPAVRARRAGRDVLARCRRRGRARRPSAHPVRAAQRRRRHRARHRPGARRPRPDDVRGSTWSSWSAWPRRPPQPTSRPRRPSRADRSWPGSRSGTARPSTTGRPPAPPGSSGLVGDVLDRLAAARGSTAGDAAGAIEAARRRVDLDPLDEPGQRRVMELLARVRRPRRRDPPVPRARRAVRPRARRGAAARDDRPL